MLFVFDLDKVCSIDILYNHCIKFLSKFGHLENKNFVRSSSMSFLILSVVLYFVYGRC